MSARIFLAFYSSCKISTMYLILHEVWTKFFILCKENLDTESKGNGILKSFFFTQTDFVLLYNGRRLFIV